MADLPLETSKTNITTGDTGNLLVPFLSGRQPADRRECRFVYNPDEPWLPKLGGCGNGHHQEVAGAPKSQYKPPEPPPPPPPPPPGGCGRTECVAPPAAAQTASPFKTFVSQLLGQPTETISPPTKPVKPHHPEAPCKPGHHHAARGEQGQPGHPGHKGSEGTGKKGGTSGPTGGRTEGANVGTSRGSTQGNVGHAGESAGHGCGHGHGGR